MWNCLMHRVWSPTVHLGTAKIKEDKEDKETAEVSKQRSVSMEQMKRVRNEKVPQTAVLIYGKTTYYWGARVQNQQVQVMLSSVTEVHVTKCALR